MIAIGAIYSYVIPVDSLNESQQVHVLQAVPLVVTTFLLFKDVFGRSPGKLVFRMRIVKFKNQNHVPNPLALIFRNVFLLFGIIEPLVLLSNKNHQRIGDMLAGTLVVIPATHKKIFTDEDLIGNPVDDLSQPSECVACGATIPANESKCPKCGWSYKH